MRGSQVLEQFDLFVEMDEECRVFVPQNLVAERFAGRFFLIEDVSLAEACVHHEAESQREIALKSAPCNSTGWPTQELRPPNVRRS